MFSWAVVTWTVAIFSAGAVVKSEGDVVRNVSVSVVSLKNKREPFSVETTISLNVSWLPPENDSKFFSYSVLVTRVQLNLTNSTGNVYQNNGNVKVSSFCPEGSIYYVGQDVNQTHVLLPQDRFGAPDRSTNQLDIEPACSYSVQIFAKPRNDGDDNTTTTTRIAEATTPSTSAVFTVPECVDRRCNCEAMLDVLPMPIVSVVNPYKGGTLISWKIQWNRLIGDHHRTDIKSYKISVGIPYLISSNDGVAYNKTLIFTGTGNDTSFLWSQGKLKKGTKFFVTAQDSYGCSGREGTDSVKRPRHHSFYRKNIAAIIFAGLVALCLITSGLLNFIKYFMQNHKYKLFSRTHKFTRQFISILHKPKIEVLLQNENILYFDKKIKVNV